MRRAPVTEPPDAPSLVVEFVGLPGSGKSTIAAHARAQLRAAGVVCDDPLEPVAPSVPRTRRVARKAGRCLAESLRHPRQSVRLLKLVRSSGQRGGDFVHRAESWLVVRAVVRSARDRSGVHLLDQAMLQELCSISLRGDWRACLPAADHGPEARPDLVVHVAIDPATASRRLDERPGVQSRIELLSGEERLAALERHRGDLDEILAASRARHGSVVTWMSVDGGHDPERSAADVVAAIRTLAGSRAQEIGSSTESPRARR